MVHSIHPLRVIQKMMTQLNNLTKGLIIIIIWCLPANLFAAIAIVSLGLMFKEVIEVRINWPLSHAPHYTATTLVHTRNIIKLHPIITHTKNSWKTHQRILTEKNLPNRVDGPKQNKQINIIAFKIIQKLVRLFERVSYKILNLINS